MAKLEQLEKAFASKGCQCNSETIVCTTPSPPSAGGIEPLTKFSKRGGLTGPQLSEGGCWERGVNFSGGEGGCSFHIKIN